MKDSIKNYYLEEAEDIFERLGEARYRARQLFSWLYAKNAASFDEMSNYSKELRSKLEEEFSVSPLVLEERLLSKIDGTEKFLFKTEDGHFIESVLLRNEASDDGRLTICISSQIGCAMGCTFCSTAKIGFIRNLTVAEILDQIIHVRRATGLLNNNIVFMGMGEPFNNYDNVIKAANIMNYSFGFHISVRKITISTCGILPAIKRYVKEKHLFNLAISLNDSDPALRKKNMPVENKYPIKEVADFINKNPAAGYNRMTLEYVMRKDNISKKNAEEIKKLFKFAHVMLNLIPLNSPECPDKKDIEKFMQYCSIMNIPIIVRKSLGSDISGGCGQLAGKKYTGGSGEIIEV